jgi:hypothetical protein
MNVVTTEQTDSWPETLAGLCRYGVRHADDPDLVFHARRILGYVPELPPAECRRVARDLTRELAEEQRLS